MEELEAKIEDAVRSKKVNVAKDLIGQYLSKYFNEQSVLKSCEWYRRLSRYRDGLLLILKLNPFDQLASKKVKLGAAEFLSIVGSNHFARRLIEEISPQTSEEYESVGTIYFSAGEYGRALEYFKRRVELLNDKDSYVARATVLTQSDCLAHLGRFDEAVAQGKIILSKTPELLFNSIVKQAIGEYLVRSGKVKSGMKWLEEALAQFPGEKKTYDHALLYRWMGFGSVKLGKKSLGRKYFDLSTKIIKKTGLREEIWLENFNLAAELKLLPESEALRLEFYPGLRKGFFKRKKYNSLNLGDGGSLIELNLSSDDYRLGPKKFLGIPSELKFLAYLRIAEEWGMGLELIKVVMWPEEGHSYQFLEDRTIQLLKRLKKTYKIPIAIKNRRVYLGQRELKKIRVTIDPIKKVPDELIKLREFNIQDVMRIFAIKKTQATVWIGRYIEDNLVKLFGRGPATRYQVTSTLRSPS